MKKDLNLGMLATELGIFIFVLGLGILTGLRSLAQGKAQYMEPVQAVSWFLIAFGIALTIIVLLILFVKFKLPYYLLMSVVIFIGSSYVMDAFIPSIMAMIGAAVLVILYLAIRNIVVHNIVIMLTVAGIAAYLGLIIPAIAVIVLMAALSVYDVIAVLKTGFMVKAAEKMMQRGAMMLFIIPKKIGSISKRLKEIKLPKKKQKEREFIMIGTGDVVFPSVLAVAALQNGLLASLFVAIGALIGIIIVHFALIKFKRPLPALPPIALFSSLGFMLALLI